MTIYNIPAGHPFLDTLARSLLEKHADNLLALSDTRIFLPTRRGCRNLRDSFLKIRHGKPLLLPNMQPIGDVDDDAFLIELSAKGLAETYLAIPPSIPTMQRQFLLARMVMQLPEFAQNWDSAIALGRALGLLLDQIYTENRDIKDLPSLVREEELATHWQITVDFLEILSQSWPAILEDHGYIDAADRRNRLIMALADFWEKHPPNAPIIAAGSTGSIPATSRLLKVISELPHGSVILPGLDQELDEESWQALGSNVHPEQETALTDTHPQATLKTLLENLAVKRKDIALWPAPEPTLSTHEIRSIDTRRHLMSETMRPAQTTEQWRYLPSNDTAHTELRHALKDVELYHCATPQEEALTIGMIMRDALENHEDKMIALITPDRDLANRVQAIAKRWDINIDDSAGYNLNLSSIGGFFDLSAKVILNDFSPAPLTAFLKHTKTHIGMDAVSYHRLLKPFEEFILRGHHRQKGIEGLHKKHEQAKESEYIRIEENDSTEISAMIEHLTACFAPLTTLMEKDDQHSVKDWLTAHIQVLEKGAAKPDDERALYIWSNEEGEAAATFIKELTAQSHSLPPISFQDYAAVLKLLMQSVTMRPLYGLHPRIHILGQLEARLINADIVILAGLNEGTWPAEAKADPWMSRPMRQQFGLPTAERGIGLAAHDFAQAFCSPKVYLTRSLRQGGTPTTPARWLQRLSTVLNASGLNPDIELSGVYLEYARALNHSTEDAKPVGRPAPKPPVSKRPSRLSVTAIERWMRDPYAVYAQYVLGLRKLDDIEPSIDAALRGTIIHDLLERFVSRCKDIYTSNTKDLFLETAQDVLSEHLTDEAQIRLWWPRIQRIADWFIKQERQWRKNYTPYLSEQKGSIELNCNGYNFTLHAKADRIDKSTNTNGQRTAAVIDYKTGMPPTKKDVEAGFAAQLPLEALIIEQGTFTAQDTPLDVSYFGYWRISGGKEAGKEVKFTDDKAHDVIRDAETGLINLVTTFMNDNIPYFSLPQTDKAPPSAWQDYAHLARVQEWAALDDEENTA